MKLFAIYVGGSAPGSNIELHDMRFVVAETLADTHETLRKQWWGTPESLHIDGWMEVTRADGHAVTLGPGPAANPLRLFFVNLGGYDPGQFTELHHNCFVVAETESKAKVKALKTVRSWRSPHRDFLYQAEEVFCLNSVAQEESLHLHLEKIADSRPSPFACGYQPLRAKRRID